MSTSLPFDATTYLPSGVNAGDWNRWSFSRVNACGLDPSAFMTHRLSDCDLSLTNTIDFPSGE